MKLPALRLAAALALSATAAQAQIINTGTGTAASDAFWSVTLVNKTTNAVLFSGQAQRITTGVPSVWQSNNSPIANWIGVSSNGSFNAAGAGSINFRYVFTTSLLGLQTVVGSIGWDNRMVGYSFDGGATITQFTPTQNFDEFGFCRSSDGEFDNKPQPTCTRNFSITPTANARTFSVIIDGDLNTDGIIIQSAATSARVPEPSGVALVGAGLAALAVVARRRRRSAR